MIVDCHHCGDRMKMSLPKKKYFFFRETRDQARGRLGRNGRPRSRNLALSGTQGEVGVSLKKKKKKKKKKKIFFFFFFRETLFHSVTTQTQAVVTIYYHCIVFLLPFNGNSMCNS